MTNEFKQSYKEMYVNNYYEKLKKELIYIVHITRLYFKIE
jgi:hypothetical protein